MNHLVAVENHIPTPEIVLTGGYTLIDISMPGRQGLEMRLTVPANPGVDNMRKIATLLSSHLGLNDC